MSKMIKEENLSESSESSIMSSSDQDGSSGGMPEKGLEARNIEKQQTKGNVKLDTINKAFRDLVDKLRQKNSEEAKHREDEHDCVDFKQLKNLFDIDFAYHEKSGAQKGKPEKVQFNCSDLIKERILNGEYNYVALDEKSEIEKYTIKLQSATTKALRV